MQTVIFNEFALFRGLIILSQQIEEVDHRVFDHDESQKFDVGKRQ